MKSKEKFSKFEELGSKALSIMRKNAFSPEEKKELRTWNLTEVATLVGRSVQAIREKEKKNLLPSPHLNNKTKKRFYTLANINAIRDCFKTRPHKKPGLPPVTIAFTNLKGGVAKSTGAIHSAHYFALQGYKVLLIDVDSQASATGSFGYAPDEDIKKEQTLYQFFTGKTKSIEPLILKTCWDGLDLIPANLTLYGVELELPALRERAITQGKDFKIFNILKKGIQQLSNDYDIVIIDCPPSMSILNTNSLYAASGLIIPCPPEVPDIASMIQFFGMIKGTLDTLPEKEFDFIRILITKHDGSKSSIAITDVLRQLYGTHVMRAEMYNTQVVKKARTEMNSIYELTEYKGSKQTFNRAKVLIDEVNKEIETHVQDTWAAWENYYKEEKKQIALTEVEG